MIVPSMKKETYIRYTNIWKRKEQEENKVREEQILEIIRLYIV